MLIEHTNPVGGVGDIFDTETVKYGIENVFV